MKKSNNISSFFIEIVFVMLFFSLATVIIMKISVYSSVSSQESQDKNVALIISQNILEDKREDYASSVIYFDDKGKECPEDNDSKYYAVINVEDNKTKAGILKDVDVKVYKTSSDKMITCVSTSDYFPDKGVER